MAHTCSYTHTHIHHTHTYTAHTHTHTPHTHTHTHTHTSESEEELSSDGEEGAGGGKLLLRIKKEKFAGVKAGMDRLTKLLKVHALKTIPLGISCVASFDWIRNLGD